MRNHFALVRATTAHHYVAPSMGKGCVQYLRKPGWALRSGSFCHDLSNAPLVLTILLHWARLC